ncbi:MAG: prepilin-type N-terminal cleavage/methylation domain-containing protein [Phycisphaera sp.]|nr:MAG: prepilin-type N-terminal cleavage/methylation domain-containing protein [Phycisphaera sp.]
MSRTRSRQRGFTMLEVMVSIAILSVLSAALITFGFGLAGRRDRLVREGERGAVLARVLDRLERTTASAEEHARHGEDWLELSGRGVWPATDRAGVPAGPVGYSARLSYSKYTGELAWRESTDSGETVELVVGDIEAVLVDHFDDLVTTSGSQPPLRVCVWLAPTGWEPATPDDLGPDSEGGELVAPEPEFADLHEEELPTRPADIVFVVAAPAGASVPRSEAGSGSGFEPGGDRTGVMP